MALKTAFCCATLKTGTLAAGWFTLVVVILNALIMQSAFTRTVQQEADFKRRVWEYKYPDTPIPREAIFILFYIVTAVAITVMVCLLYGTYRRRPWFLVPYIVVLGLGVGLLAVMGVYQTINGAHWVEIMPDFIFAGLGIYVVCIVASHFVELWHSQPLDEDNHTLKSEAALGDFQYDTNI